MADCRGSVSFNAFSFIMHVYALRQIHTRSGMGAVQTPCGFRKDERALSPIREFTSAAVHMRSSNNFLVYFSRSCMRPETGMCRLLEEQVVTLKLEPERFTCSKFRDMFKSMIYLAHNNEVNFKQLNIKNIWWDKYLLCLTNLFEE